MHAPVRLSSSKIGQNKDERGKMPLSSIKTGHFKDEESRRLAFAPLTVPICAKPSDGKVGTTGVHPS